MCDDESDPRKSSSSDGVNYKSVPDAEREMATLSLQEFEQQKFEQSLTYLKKLISERPQDSKVFHNYSVVDYYLSNCKKTEQLNKKMLEVCNQAHIDIQDLETLDDVDNCIVLYNQAVVLYHLHQFHSAICILDKVYQFIEPLEETLAKNICFLLLECYLCIYQAKKATYMIGYIETMLYGSNKNCNKTNQKEKDTQKEENNDSISEATKRKLQLCKARCYAMMKTSKACKREIKNLMSSGSNVQNIPAFYLKSQLEYQRGNYRKALKLLNSVTLPEDVSKYFKETGDCLPCIFYNNVACIHFYMGKPNLGIFYIGKALEAFDTTIKSVTNESDASESKLNARPLHLMSISTRHQLIYNLGMQYLQAQKFERAFDCFIQVVQSYHSNPRLWLRIAECCIHIQKPDNHEQFVEYKGKPFIKSIVSAGPHCKLIMNSSVSDKSSTDDSKLHATPKIESPSLQFAMVCLKNALFLIGEYSYKDMKSESTDPSPEDDSTYTYKSVPVLPSNILQDYDVLYLRNAILINCAYVSLCLGDVVVAYDYTQMILWQPFISDAHKFFTHMYAGEALLVMDKITKAVENLNLDTFDFEEELPLTCPVSSSEHSLKHQVRFDFKFSESTDGSRFVGNLPKWFPDAIATAKFITHYNLAVAYAVREEWAKALECLLQLNPNEDVPPVALSLLMYIHCHQGSADDTNTYVNRYIKPGKK